MAGKKSPAAWRRPLEGSHFFLSADDGRAGCYQAAWPGHKTASDSRRWGGSLIVERYHEAARKLYNLPQRIMRRQKDSETVL